MICHWLQVVVSALLLGQGDIFLLAGYVGCSECYVPESSLFILTKVVCLFVCFFSPVLIFTALFGNRVIAV